MLRKIAFIVLMVMTTIMIFCFAAWSEPNSQQTIAQGKSGKLSAQKRNNQEAPTKNIITPQILVDAITHAIDASAEKAKTAQNPPPPDNYSWWFSFFLVIFTGFLVIVGGIQCYIIFWTLKATTVTADAANKTAKAAIVFADAAGKTVALTEKHLITSQRAFVFIKQFCITVTEAPKSIIIIPEWINNGGTQTINLHTHDNGKFFPLADFPNGLPDDFSFPDLVKGDKIPILLGPKDTFFGRDIVFNEQAADATIAGKGRLYIWGWVEYNDIFENTLRHRTEFCNEIILTRVGDKVRVEPRIYKKHNGADEQCMKKPIT
jgi:hypothetical protein